MCCCCHLCVLYRTLRRYINTVLLLLLLLLSLLSIVACDAVSKNGRTQGRFLPRTCYGMTNIAFYSVPDLRLVAVNSAHSVSISICSRQVLLVRHCMCVYVCL